MNFYVLTVIFYLLNVIYADDETVHTVQYTDDDLKRKSRRGIISSCFTPHGVGTRRALAPTWEQLAEMLSEGDGNVRIAKVDCMKDSESEGVKFRGTRDLPSLSNFINEQLGSESADETPQIPEPTGGLVELTEDTFYDHVANGKHFVKFYAPWCGHCQVRGRQNYLVSDLIDYLQKLAPTWEGLAQSLEFEEGVSVCKIDCTQYRGVCNEFEVKGYPSLLWIEDGKKVDKYQGPRSHDDLKLYVNKMLGTKPEGKDNAIDDSKDEAQGVVLVLTGDNFKHGIQKGISFVKFFAPWCGHCKRLAPTWEELGKKLLHDNSVNIVKVDCTLEVNKELCKEQEVDGFPTIYLYKNGLKISEYTGNRSLEDLVEFVMKHTDGHDEL
ncbi:protein disulfide-isomerase c17h9.14c-related [Holotrichia oblita]|uniref:Protein disulfide-isomerase c17h9.14c-related n=1 Tax=Holotrichia oblita TaxID=644536 RepID=A0ACB9SRU7_HOLOL|nr:protein disulfide-isomerase c17h9.14c-related [Holotrichia oblita]